MNKKMHMYSTLKDWVTVVVRMGHLPDRTQGD